MQLTFLQAAVPLTKTYEKRADGSYIGGAYPGVTNFTSYVEDVDTIAQFAEALVSAASAGHCLITSSLTRPIKEESRAGLSDSNERREWILLDIDGLSNIATVEEFVTKVLPPHFQSASYVVQYSPSQGIKPGVRAHVYFMLYDKVDPRAIESWLAEVNLTHPELSDQVTLSNSRVALSYPLDRVASRNGRIVYVTPPNCSNFPDPVKDRIDYVQKDYDRVSFSFAGLSPSDVASRVREKVNDLRYDAGLNVSRKKEHTRITPDGKELLDDSLVDAGYITSWHEDNAHFMRCNINGGDSYAYYYHRDREDPYLHNFKGEPSMRLSRFDPQFYTDNVRPHFEELQKKRPRPFIFRDMKSDKYYAGLRKDKEIVEQPNCIGASDKKVADYFAMKGSTSPPAVIPTWELKFDPTVFDQWNEDNYVFNTWRPTEYQLNTMFRSNIPSVIDKILTHVTGNDEQTYNHFINWLAYVQQTRKKTGTAWVLHGVPGTGKGLLFHNIITPIFGPDYCHTKQFRDLTDNFNGWMERSIFLNIDEANSDDMGRIGRSIINNLKNWITEPRVSVRHMQATAKDCDSFINFIFTTNDFGVIPIQEGDRRINVAPRQEKKLEITKEEVAQIEAELQQFSGYLTHYKVDEDAVRLPMDNNAKQKLQEAARTSIEEFFHAIATGDLTYFVDGTDEETTAYTELAMFKEAVTRWIDDAKHDRESLVKTKELKAAHVVMCRDKGIKLGAFKSMAAKRGHPVRKLRGDDDARAHGWRVEWDISLEDKADLKIHLKPITADLEEKIKSEIEGSYD
jgi:hypothetical protein